jgi:hypothetical protein
MPRSVMTRRRNVRKLHRNSLVNNPQPTTPILVTGATALAAVLTMTFDQVIALDGVPQYTTDVVGATALSAAKTGLNTVAITFSATIAAATEVRIPYEEPAVRNGSGGFVSTSTFPV